MRFSRNCLIPAALLLGAAITEADHPGWIRFIEAGSRIEQIFFRPFNLPAGPVNLRRPPAETRLALNQAIASTPNDAELYSLRAAESELMLAFDAAEADWRKHAELAAGKASAYTALADYYHRRLKVPEELAALAQAAAQPSPASERFYPATAQQSYKTFQRMLDLCRKQLLDHAALRDTYQKFTARYPNQPLPLQQWIQAETAAQQYERAEALIASYSKQFAYDSAYPVSAHAAIERAKGNAAAALTVYDRAFQPLAPGKAHFQLLRETRNLRRFLLDARAAAQQNPMALQPVARQFHYYVEEGNIASAQRLLAEYRRRKEARPNSWTGEELLTVAKLWESYGNDRNEAARHYYALYSLPGATPEQQEEALFSIALLLLSVPEPRLALGSGDLSFYRDIAAADPYPGFLNGILSLLLNSSDAAFRFQNQEQSAQPYFQRVRAAELIALFESRFPASPRRATLQHKLIEAYSLHGDNDAVLAAGRRFLTAFPAAAMRMQVSLLMADAHARKNQLKEELAVYDELLAELAKRSEGVPLGEGIVNNPGRTPVLSGPRSPEYARVLDRYISRLASLKRVPDALILLRRELDRNPDDPGLYERLAAFLEQNKLAPEIEAVYKRAMAKFQDKGWRHKLARFYLRQKQTAAFSTLTADIVKIFSGTELEDYFRQVVAAQSLDAVLYRQINLYAHQRFPHNLTFVQNLLGAYQQRATFDAAAYEALLRRYWVYDDGLRSRFFEHLSRTGKLATELRALNAPDNSAAQRMLGEAQAWRSHFEEAAAPLLTLANATPGDPSIGARVSSLHRSLAAYDPLKANDAAAIEANLILSAPRSTAARTRLGELAREYPRVAGRDTWNTIPQIAPGDPEGYLEAATLHWDYFEYDDALRHIQAGRKRLNSPALHAYEAGAIYENKRLYPKAIEEYASGAVAQPGGSSAESRLIALARRPQFRQPIEDATVRLAAGANPPTGALALRISLLEAQGRRGDLEALLMNLAAQAQTFDLLARIEDESRRFAFPNVEERCLNREIELTPDPVDKLRLRLRLARFYEEKKNIAAAARTVDSVYRENSMLLGVMRAAVDYHWRNRNTARAVELLATAANGAHPSLKSHLQFEAARKATESGQPQQARQLLSPLLAAEPFAANYLGAMADTYARANDDAGLRAFYRQTIDALGKAPLPAQAKIERIAAMRRALIPVLVRAGEPASAAGQYIEILNRYPEDESLIQEAAGFVSRNNMEGRLTDYYTKSAASSPKDYRFPLLLAKLYTNFENFPAAIEQYAKVTEIRPDRTDLWAARGDLEERLLRFDDAAATFTRLYTLSYKNSVWMERVAEIRARQQKPDEAVAALRIAFLDGRAEAPQMLFEVASRLERWSLHTQALPFAEKGAALAGQQLLSHHFEGAQCYARVMTRARRYAAAHAKAAGGDLLPAIAGVVKSNYTPQEKTQFAAFLDKIPNIDPAIGRQAGIPAWESRRLQALILEHANDGESQQYVDRLRQLQKSRVQLAELGGQLEAYAKAVTNRDAQRPIWLMAAEAFRAAGDDAAELRALTAFGSENARYLELLARRDPQRLTALASNAAIDAAFDSAKPDLALQAIAARGARRTPVWTRSYTALAGLFFNLGTPEIDAAFRDALGPVNVGERLARPVNRSEEISGNVWYYYGSRYGEYLDIQKKPQFDDFLPSSVESAPGRVEAYFDLAEYYRATGRLPQAAEHYELALQLDANHAPSLHGAALVLWAQQRPQDAALRWRQALNAITGNLSQRRAPSGTPQHLAGVLDQLAANKLLGDLRPEAERAVRAYVQRYGSYQTGKMLRHFDVAWMASLSRDVTTAVDLLTVWIGAEWIPAAQKEPLYTRMLEETATRLAKAAGNREGMEIAEYTNWRQRWIEHLLDLKQVARARAALDGLEPETRDRLSWILPVLDMRVAAQEGRLDRVLADFRGDSYQLRNTAEQMLLTDPSSARRMLKVFYERQLDSGDRTAANFLGLAEIALQSNDTAEAVRVLRRMSLVSQPAFLGLKEAGNLLRRFGKNAEADPFYNDFARAVPWELDPRRVAPPAPNRTVAQLELDVRNNPEDDSLKLQLFRAARQLGRHRQATAAFEAAAGNGLALVFQYDEGAGGDMQPNQYWQEMFLGGRGLERPERASYARELADSLSRTDRLQGALLSRRLAEKLEPAQQGPARIAAYESELKRRRDNRLRKPVASDALEQENVVRPILAATGGAR
ncbi:MAG: hypothetical protein JNK48_00655 [Bryobacterales bacterium]|nr:hypothetical protein [Bryobacterales bacterium]